MRANYGLGFWVAILLATPALPQAAQSPEAMLGAALHQERVTGNMQAAIEGYRKVLATKGVSRSVAAQAQFHIGLCYEKLGNQESRKAFESVVNNYADQKDLVTQARARLAAMGGGINASAGRQARLVWDNATDYWGRVTADGRYLSHVDWSTGDLALHDFHTGQSRRVTNYGGYVKAEGEAESTSISPDGKRIIFNWQRWDKASKTEGPFQLRIINADGTGERLLRQMPSKTYLESYGWSPDGKWIATCLEEQANSIESASGIELLWPETGQRKPIPTTSKSWKAGIAFSPDGKWLAYSESPVKGVRNLSLFVVRADGSAPAESKLAEDAELMGWTPGGDALVFQRIENSVNRLYLLPFAEGKAQAAEIPLHIPSIGRASALGITPAGALYYGVGDTRLQARIHRLDEATGLSPDAVATFEVAGIGFANNQGNLRFSPDGKLIAATSSAQSIKIRGINDARERIHTLQVKELRRFEWMPGGKSLLVSALGLDGKLGLYTLDLGTGMSTLTCPINRGLVFMPSPDGKSAFHLTTRALSAVDLATGNERTLLNVDLDGQGPTNMRLSRDNKSLALTSFALIGVYDIASGTLKELFKRSGEVGDSVWVADWSADGKHILALVRGGLNDRQRELRVYPVAGGVPRRHALTGAFRDFSTSPDGIHAAIVHAERHDQVWALENFLPAKK